MPVTTIPPRTRTLRGALLWGASFLAFPISGLLASTAVGPVDSPVGALAAGAIVGTVVGGAQSLLSDGRLRWARWIPATAAGVALGHFAGSAAVGFGTSLPSLAAMGAITGAVLGVAQALALTGSGRRWLWAAATPLVWAIGWTVTTLVGVDVEAQHAVFGASGAIIVTVLTGALLGVVLPGDGSAPGSRGAVRA